MIKKALVIGASGGIGLETARTLIRDGMRVWGTYFSDKASLETLIKETPETALSISAMDCSDDASVDASMTEIIKNFTPVDVLVYSVAPPIKHAPVLKNDWENYQKHLEIQVKGFLRIIKFLTPQFSSSYKTKIIVILSEYCVGKPASGISDYITAKYALMGVSKTLAVELARNNSTVNMLSPGMTETDLLSTLPAKAVEFSAMNNPLKRIAKPKDVADAISFLASDKSDYLNGVNLLINGGGVMI